MVPETGPPGPNVSIAPRFLGVTGVFLVLGIIVYITRMYTRVRPVQRLGIDDWIISVAAIFMTCIWAMCVQAAQYGMGRHNYYISAEDQIKAGRILYIVQPIWVWSVAFIKISMACMLLRILRSKTWRLFLYANIALLVASATSFMLILLLQCQPVSAFWNPSTPNAKCWGPVPAQIGLYSNAAVSIITDFIFTLLPFTFIRKMKLPLRQRVVIGLLMCMGLFATSTVIVKMTVVKSYSTSGDNFYRIIDLYMWGFLEEEIGFIAVCIPCLKAPFERVLKQLRVVSSEESNSHTTHSRSGYLHFGKSQSQNHQLESMPARAHRRADDEAAETQSQENILPMGTKNGEILKTTELSFVSEEIRDLES